MTASSPRPSPATAASTLLRADLDRFNSLLSGNDGEPLFEPRR
ncbi:MAG: hypothetical protein ACRDP7_12160 [Trebonia sp.]